MDRQVGVVDLGIAEGRDSKDVQNSCVKFPKN